MATFYVETSANGGGQAGSDGSQSKPWLWDEFVSAFTGLADNDILEVGPGIHEANTNLDIAVGPSPFVIVGDASQPVIRANSIIDAIIESGGGSALVIRHINNLDLDANGLANHAGTSDGIPWGVSWTDCIFRNALSHGLDLRHRNSAVRCAFLSNAGGGVTFPLGGQISHCLAAFNSNLGFFHESEGSGFISCVDIDNGIAPLTGGNGGPIIASSVIIGNQLRAISRAGVAVGNVVDNPGGPGIVGNTSYRNYAVDNSIRASPTTSDLFFESNNQELTESIFIDSANLDLRLTSYGKNLPGVQAIMAGLVNVPGITTDSLADLFAGAPQSPFRSPVFGGA